MLTPHMLIVVAAVLSVVALVESLGRNWAAWAGLCLAVALLLPFVR